MLVIISTKYKLVFQCLVGRYCYYDCYYNYYNYCYYKNEQLKLGAISDDFGIWSRIYPEPINIGLS